MLSGETGEDQAVLPRELLALRKPRERLSDLGRERHGSHLAGLRRGERASRVARADVHDAPGEVDVAPAQREQLAAAHARKGRGEEQRGVLHVRGRAHQRPHLLGTEHLDVTRYPNSVALRDTLTFRKRAARAKTALESAIGSAPERIRTSDLRFRRASFRVKFGLVGRGSVRLCRAVGVQICRLGDMLRDMVSRGGMFLAVSISRATAERRIARSHLGS